MSRYDLKINGNSYAVEIADISGGQATVNVNGTIYHVEIAGGQIASAAPAVVAAPAPAPSAAPAPVAAPAAAPAPAASGDGEVITSPMPGHVLSVAVSEGDTVSNGDTVVVIEAMKMENEIKAHIAGTVTEVRVSAGQDVGVNDVLVVIGG